MPLEELSDPRDTINGLIRSRRAFKGTVTRHKSKATSILHLYKKDDDPTQLELILKKWEEALDKYAKSDEVVMTDPMADDKDSDELDLGDHETQFLLFQTKVIGFRRDFNKSQEPTPSPPALDGDGNDGSTHRDHGLPNLTIHLPQTITEDIDLRAFLKWKPTWDNYARLMSLSLRPQSTQISVFWQCCSPGFFRIVEHSIGIKADTGRSVNEIIQLIILHLRSLRNRHIDLKEFLSIRQKDGQDYSSVCNEIKELGEYADTANITEDQLNIGILVQAMKSKRDRAKLLEENPKTFEDARRFLLSSESAKQGARQVGFSSTPGPNFSVQANKQSSYSKRKSGFPHAKPTSLPKISEVKKDRGTSSCFCCGGSRHPRRDCPAKEANCTSCGRKGHLSHLCRSISPKSSASIKIGTSRICSIGASTSLLPVKLDVENGSSCVVNAIPDTGAEISVMGLNMFLSSGLHIDLQRPIRNLITAVDGSVLRQTGSFIANVVVDGHVAGDVSIVVCENVKDFYLDLKTCKGLNIISKDFPRPMIPPATTVNSLATSNSPVWSEREEWIKSLPEHSSDPELFKTIEEKLHLIYARVFDDSSQLRSMIGPIVGEPMRIRLKDNYKPFAIHAARQIAYCIRDLTFKELQYMQDRGIIAPVGDEPSEWCHPVVIAPKPNGKIRFCVDLTKLNTEVIRATHPTKTPAEAVSGFNKDDAYFAKLDLVKGYWQMSLHPDSQHLTTFITPFGRYKFLRAPMGFISTGDSYSYRGDIAMDGLPINKVIDDMGLGRPTLPQLVSLVCDTLERCNKHNLTVNKEKSKLCAAAIDFVGYRVSRNSIEVDQRKTSAIADFPIPTTITDLRSFMGLVNQLGNFSSSVASAAGPLRDLLKKKNEFVWLPDHTQAFTATKKALVSPPVLAMFDQNAQTTLLTDASKLHGLGFALMQRQSDTDPWRLIQCGSRFLQDTETRYAIVELEALAIWWAINKCKVYLLGLPHFVVLTDQKSLVSLFNNFSIDAIDNPKVQNYRTKLLQYSFIVEWKRGKDHSIPDALSRAPVSDPDESDVCDFNLGTIITDSVRQVSEDLLVEDIRRQAREDADYGQLRHAILRGFEPSSLTPYVRLFTKQKRELSLDGELILRGCQLVIPRSAVKDVLRRLHSSHQGVEKTKRRARQAVFWPGYTNDITTTVETCEKCQYYCPSPLPEPLVQEPLPSRPFEIVTSDLFQFGSHHFLVYADRLSGYPLLSRFPSNPSSSDLIHEFRIFFSLMGAPNILRTDNGPQYRSRLFVDFLTEWGVKWTPSSPHHPQSNGHAEVTVKIIKHLVAKHDGNINSDNFHAGLLELRNGPRQDGLSPAQRLFGHPLRSQVPCHWRSFAPKWQQSAEEADKHRLEISHKRKSYFDRFTRPREAIPSGTSVLVQDPNTKRWDSVATIVGKPNHRRYHLRFPSGRVLWRNVKFLRRHRTESSDPPNPPTHEPNDPEPRRSIRLSKAPDRLKY
ncbi:uncharacterized protein LOC131881541 [Tigriopus californicus]|uniref:uncharacterized protein LOC131881541 n=1 Tax=Tigriopus californicus TaxID=6832 RepID=UPI0027DA13FD|nr:uncharacterized protein LOC131881541 [Tigriopus californicus]